MKIVKVKTHYDSEIFIDLDRIDYIDPKYNIVYFSNRYVELDEESMKKVVGLIERSEEKSDSDNKGWIPVSERLPENDDYVMFCDIDNDIMVGFHDIHQRTTHFTERGSWVEMKNVVAWQPLPEPYKGE